MKLSYKILILTLSIFIGIYSVSAAEIDLLGLTLDVKESGIDIDNVNITIEIYDAATAGNLIYNSSTGFENNVSNGKVDIILGDETSGYELNLTYGTTYYMELIINGTEMDFNGLERQKFQSIVGNVTEARLNISGTVETHNLIPAANATFDLGSGTNFFRNLFLETLNIIKPLNTSQIEDVYLLNTGDTATGDYTFDSPTFRIDSGNNFIGIGTTTPANALNVVGDGNFSGALYIGGVQITADSNVSGGGTSNYLVKFLDTATIGNSLIYDTGTLIGIDTISPQGKLEISNSTALSLPWLNITDGTNGIVFVIDNDQRVGIRTYPSEAFHVLGSGLFTGNLTVQGITDPGNFPADLINTTHIAADTILAGDIAAGSVATSEILDRTITADDLADNILNTTLILDRTLLSDDLADGSVNSTIILDNDIITEDILLNTINGSDIDLNSEFIIANLSVTDNITAQFNFTVADSILTDYIYPDTETFVRIDNLTILQDLRVLGSSYLGSFIIKDDLSVGQTNITSTNTGIGTLSPLFLLHLNLSDSANTTFTELLALEKTTTGIPADGLGASILFKAEDDAREVENISMISGILEDVSNGTERGALVFYTGYGDVNGIISNLSSAEAMRITGAGYVGIGTTLPSSLLDIYGGNLTITNSSTDYVYQKFSAGAYMYDNGTALIFGH